MSEWKDGLPGVGVECEFKSPGSHFAENFVWCKYHGTLVNGEGLIIEHLKTHPTLTCVDSYDPALTTFRPIKKREPKPGEIWLYEEAPCLYTSDHGIYNLVTSEVALPSQADTKRAEFLAPSAKAYIARELLKDTNHKDEFVFCVLKDAARLDEE